MIQTLPDFSQMRVHFSHVSNVTKLVMSTLKQVTSSMYKPEQTALFKYCQLDRFRFVTFKEFEQAVSDVADWARTQGFQQSTAVVQRLAAVSQDISAKSSEWVLRNFQIKPRFMLDMDLDELTEFHLKLPLIVKSLLQRGMNRFFFVDDGSYSGLQMGEQVELVAKAAQSAIHSNPNSLVHLYFAIPFMSMDAKALLERVRRNYPFLRLHFYPRVQEIKSTRDREERRCSATKSIGKYPFAFEHKIPDETALNEWVSKALEGLLTTLSGNKPYPAYKTKRFD
jgi:hypothetical protein